MHDTIRVIDPPSDPVTLALLKKHLRLLDDDAEDDILTHYIRAARECFENVTNGRYVLSCTVQQKFPDFPRCHYEPLKLRAANVTDVAEITYIDHDGVEQDLPTWESDLSGCPALVYLPEGLFPRTHCRTPRPVTVTFEAGWESVGDVPSSVLLGIMMLAGNWYANRESHGATDLKKTPYGFDRLCDLYDTGLGGI